MTPGGDRRPGTAWPRACRAVGAGIVVLLLAGGLPAAAARPAADPLASRVADHLADQSGAAGVPGTAWAVVRDGRTIVRGTAGDDGDGEPVGPHTRFLLGSVAKPVTAMAVLQLVERGRLGLDDRVQQHLPWFHPRGDGAAGMTVRHLLTHTSGISTADGLAVADRYRTGARTAEDARELDDVALVGSPGSEHRYSSANYLLLGALVEQVTGTRFGDHLRGHLLQPIGMSDAVVDESTATSLPPGHRLAFGRAWRFDPGYDGAGVSYGYLGASLEDCTALLRVLLQRGTIDGSRVLRPGTVELMESPAVAAAGGHYGLGWRVGRLHGARVVWHSGATPGYFATVLLAPESNTGVVVLANGYSVARDAQLNEMAFDVLRLVRGEDPRPASPDRLLLAGPWALLVLAAGLVAGSVAVLVRGRRLRAVRTAGGVLVVALVAAGLRLGIPWSQGIGWDRVALWDPGLAVAVDAVLAGSAVHVGSRGLLLARAAAARRGPGWTQRATTQ
jgi:D-alanyl-D-alanine carboxypeptidase